MIASSGEESGKSALPPPKKTKKTGGVKAKPATCLDVEAKATKTISTQSPSNSSSPKKNNKVSWKPLFESEQKAHTSTRTTLELSKKTLAGKDMEIRDLKESLHRANLDCTYYKGMTEGLKPSFDKLKVAVGEIRNDLPHSASRSKNIPKKFETRGKGNAKQNQTPKRSDAKLKSNSRSKTHTSILSSGSEGQQTLRQHSKNKFKPPSDPSDSSSSSPSSSSSSSDSEASSIKTSKRHRKSKKVQSTLKFPALRVWGGSKDEDDANIFLSRAERHMDQHNVPSEDRATLVLEFMSGQPFKLWDLHLRSLTRQGKKPSWKKFRTFIKERFGVIEPEKVARKKYDALKQNGNAFDYVTDTMALIQEMESMENVRPSKGDIISRFVTNAKPDLQDFLLKKEPENGWVNCRQLFDSAIKYGQIEKQKSQHHTPSAPKKLAAMKSEPPSGQTKKQKQRSKWAAKKKARKANQGDSAGEGLAGAFSAGAELITEKAMPQAAAAVNQPAKRKRDDVAPPEAPPAPKTLTPNQVMSKLTRNQAEHMLGGRCPFHPEASHTYQTCSDKPKGF